MFTLTVSAEELEMIRAAAPEVAERANPRKPKAMHKAMSMPVEPFNPNTGDARLDAFMRAHHRPDWQTRQRSALRRTVPGMISMPTPPKGWPLEPKDARRFARFFG